MENSKQPLNFKILDKHECKHICHKRDTVKIYMSKKWNQKWTENQIRLSQPNQQFTKSILKNQLWEAKHTLTANQI